MSREEKRTMEEIAAQIEYNARSAAPLEEASYLLKNKFKIAAALRASAAPEEGKREEIAKALYLSQRSRLIDQQSITAQRPWRDEDIPDIFWNHFLADADAILALSPDSRKAEPVTWRWKYFEADNWHYREERPQDTTGDLAQPLYVIPPEAPVADQIIGQIEDRFPNWKSYRDLIDCIDCTLHALRAALAPATEAEERVTKPYDLLGDY